MSVFNRQTFRPGGQDYAALAAVDMDDLMPPDIRQELRGDFQANALEIGGDLTPAEDDQRERVREGGDKDGDGSAMFDGAPKPVPGDELAAVVYGREPDARNDPGLMAAAGYAALSGREDAGPEIDAPAPALEAVQQQPDPMAGMEPHRGNYSALEQQQAAVIEQNGLGDLMPADARAEASAAGREITGSTTEHDDMADLMPPDIRAEVDQANSYQQGQQQGPTLGL